MQFLNPYLLLALAGVALPIIIHLFNRRSAREIPWGAMRFLLASLMNRRRRLLLEEILLLASRCLLVGCAVFALARPFSPAGSSFPWWLVMPTGLSAFVLLGTGVALERRKAWRAAAWLGALACAALCAYASLRGGRFAPRFAGSGARNLAIVLDGSTSMTLTPGGESNFERARGLAAKLVEDAPRGSAFSLVVAGSVPAPAIPAPVSDRKYALAAIAAAKPVQGVMDAPAALAAAAATLAESSRAARQIAMFTDGQAIGWHTGDLSAWRFLREAFAKLPFAPGISVRALELPQGIRNIAMKSIHFSRPLIGTDREVRIDVALVNTGRESVTPSKVTLRVDGIEMTDRSVTQMAPGAESQVSFMHRFTTPGAALVEASVDAHDDLPLDDTMRRALQVVGQLRVLVVDDGRAAETLQRAGGYAALALMPSFAALGAEAKADSADAGAHFLVRPDLVAAPALGLRSGFAEYAAIVLADVPSLPPAQAEGIAAFVRQGGGLLVAHGARSDAAFYNSWGGVSADPRADARLMPLPIGECRIPEKGVGIDTASFRHPALALLREQGDLGDALLACWRAADATGRTERVAARLRNGEPLLAERDCGKGRVLQLFVPLDATAGTLVSRQSFLPLVQELAQYLVRPLAASLNIPPSLGATIHLASPMATGLSSGLLGEYFQRGALNGARIRRIDPTLAMFWAGSPGQHMPRDNFAARWSGSFLPRAGGKYVFHVSGDDRATVSIGSGSAHTSYYGDRQSFTLECKAGEVYPVSASLEEDGGEAAIRVEMEGPDFPRGPIPQGWLSPQKAGDDSWGDAAEAELVAPDGATLPAKMRCASDGVSLRTASPLAQGVYSVRVPQEASGWLGGLCGATNEFPICVMENPDESRLDPLSPEEQLLLMRQADISFAKDDDELAKSLQGKTFGRELWRFPAMLLFALLIAECFITRWVDSERS